MNKRGFSLIELLIVIAIIAILVGVAVPYYNDYIYDARLSVLKQNLATIRKVINQFRGDNGRGPFMVPVQNGATTMHNEWYSAADSELISGPIQNIDGTITRRSNLQYLSAWPLLINPRTGEQIPPNEWIPATGTARFVDSNPVNDIFNIDTEFAFLDANNDSIFNLKFDHPLATDSHIYVGSKGFSLDYIDINVTIDGIPY